MATVRPPLLALVSAYAERMSAGTSDPATGAAAIGVTEPAEVTRSLRMAEQLAEPPVASEQTRTLWCAVPCGDGAASAEGASVREEKARAAAAAMAARGGRRMRGRCHLQPTKERPRRGSLHNDGPAGTGSAGHGDPLAGRAQRM